MHAEDRGIDAHCYPLGVNGSQVSILEEGDKVGWWMMSAEHGRNDKTDGSPSLASCSAKTADYWKRRSVLKS
jgi:hypothetical protein